MEKEQAYLNPTPYFVAVHLQPNWVAELRGKTRMNE